MEVTAKEIGALRELTGAGPMDCKKALIATEGDQAKAIEFLREKGLAAVAKKSSRIAAEGACYAFVDADGVAAVVEVNSETDFAAKSEKFQKFIKDVAYTVVEAAPADLSALKAAKCHDSELTVDAEVQDKVFTIGENIQVRRFERYDNNGVNSAYIHMGGKIAVIVHMDVSENLMKNEAVTELGREIAMQIAAMRPMWLNSDAADAETVEKEKAIITAQLKEDEKNANKPAAVLEKIVVGRISKYFSEVCLLEQPFVKENSLSVAQYVANKAKEFGGTISVTKFTRFEKGEGIAKKEDDFAAEVARMTK